MSLLGLNLFPVTRWAIVMSRRQYEFSKIAVCSELLESELKEFFYRIELCDFIKVEQCYLQEKWFR